MTMSKADRPRRDRNGAAHDTVPVAPPCAMVIFGAGGDLTRRLVVPALYNLVTAKQLPSGFQLVGVSRGDKSSDEWRSELRDMMSQSAAHGGDSGTSRLDEAAWRWLTERMSYLPGNLNDPETYRRLGERLARLDK